MRDDAHARCLGRCSESQELSELWPGSHALACQSRGRDAVGFERTPIDALAQRGVSQPLVRHERAAAGVGKDPADVQDAACEAARLGVEDEAVGVGKRLMRSVVHGTAICRHARGPARGWSVARCRVACWRSLFAPFARPTFIRSFSACSLASDVASAYLSIILGTAFKARIVLS